MTNNPLKTKLFAFALKIVNLSRDLNENSKQYVLGKQILRSGTAIGAFVRESEQAESKKDFIHKLSIALKEANETEYWLELLGASNLIIKEIFISLINDLKELLKLLTAIIKTSKANLAK